MALTFTVESVSEHFRKLNDEAIVAIENSTAKEKRRELKALSKIMSSTKPMNAKGWDESYLHLIFPFSIGSIKAFI